MLTPICPLCHSANIDTEDSDAPWCSLNVTLTCQRCDTIYTAVYRLTHVEDVRIQNPYGPEYVTQDAQSALLAHETDEDWQEIRTNGAWYAVGFTPWMGLQGYDKKSGWLVCTDDMAAILANT